MSRDKNFANFRSKLASTAAACIPFFGFAYFWMFFPFFISFLKGMYLSDLTFIEDGSPNFLPEDESFSGSGKPKLSNLVNFGKRFFKLDGFQVFNERLFRRLVARATGDIQQHQTLPYDLKPEPTLQVFAPLWFLLAYLITSGFLLSFLVLMIRALLSPLGRLHKPSLINFRYVTTI